MRTLTLTSRVDGDARAACSGQCVEPEYPRVPCSIDGVSYLEVRAGYALNPGDPPSIDVVDMDGFGD